MSKLEMLDDKKVHVYFNQTDRSLIIEVLADEESLNLTHAALLEFFKSCGLTEEEP